MKKISGFVKKYKFALILPIIILIILGFFIFKDKNRTGETMTVVHTDFINQVSVSGKVKTESEADLGFAAGGRIGKIFVENNHSVREGQILAQLEINDLLSDLKIKELNSKTSNVDLEDAKDELEKVTKQENTKVENAYRKLLTDGLVLVPDSNSYDVVAPTLGGAYSGSEGQYKISIDKQNVTSIDFRLWTFKLEKTNRIINEEGSTPLGTRGLYISFPADPDLLSYQDTTWLLDIPNKASSVYGSNLNAYNEAKDERDLAIKNAKADYDKLLTSNDGGDSIAQAEIQKINAEIRKNTIYSPFSGIVTNIDKEVGETVSSNEKVITMMSIGTFQIESYVPEINIALIKIGDEAKVTLDAYGENVLFNAKVVSIDQAETLRDGVSTYKIKLQFNEKDDRIKSGMTANVSIIIFEKPNTVVVPGGVVFEQDGKKFVQVKNEKETVSREVILGDVSSLGQVEIISGLEEGEAVVINPLTSSAD